MKELGKKFNIFSLKNQVQMGIRKHLHFLDNWMVCSGQRFWEIVVATIEERLRLYGSKTRLCGCFLGTFPKVQGLQNGELK